MNLKELYELRNAKLDEMKAIVDAADAETRSLSEDDSAKFSTLEAEVRKIDETIAAKENLRKLDKVEAPADNNEAETRSAEEIVSAFVRGEELRGGEMTTTTDGNVIPNELSKDIVKRVSELSGIFGRVSKVNSTGTYTQIKEGQKIAAGWTDELAEVTSSEATFQTVEIGHYKLGALAKISYELINQANFDIVNEVKAQTVDAMVEKVEDGIINGTGVKQPTGLVSGGTAFNTASAAAITADELIKIAHTLKAPFQRNAAWLMNRNTLCAIRLLKDDNGQYLFHEAELTSDFAGYILGKPVLLSEKVKDFVVFYGDYARAYKVNANPAMTLQVLREKYATQGMIGVLSFLFIDGKPVNDEAYVVAKHSA